MLTRLLAIGISHRSADADLLDRAAVPEPAAVEVLHDLLTGSSVTEAVLLSTCNRVEIYTAVRGFRDGMAELVEVFQRHARIGREAVQEHLYLRGTAAAVQHLFTVAAGIDSMAVGDTQVLRQIRAAYTVAGEAGTVGTNLHRLFQRALRVGKRVHASTRLGRATEGSLADAEAVLDALAEAEELLGELTGRRAVVIGSGPLAGLAVAALRRARVAEVVVTGCSTGLAGQLAAADLAACCLDTPGGLDATAVVQAVRERKPGPPLVICDLGRSSELELTGLPGVRLVDLTGRCSGLTSAQGGLDLHRAVAIVAEEVRAFLASQDKSLARAAAAR